MLAGAPARSDDEQPLLALLAHLRSGDPGERKRAAAELYDRMLDPRAVRPLVRAAKFETDHGALIEMLRALGQSGAVEALGIIQLHALSPADDLRKAGRAALKDWLHVNRVLRKSQELPDPPHAYYGRPPRFPPDRPAGHALATRLYHLDEDLTEPTAAPPYYEPPSRDGVPPGFHFEERPRKPLIIGGGVVFGALYTAVAIPGLMWVAEPSATTFLLVPAVGPVIHSIYFFGFSDDFAGFMHLIGVLLLVDAAGQIAGLAMLTAGFVAKKPKLAPGAPEVSLWPSGARLGWTF